MNYEIIIGKCCHARAPVLSRPSGVVVGVVVGVEWTWTWEDSVGMAANGGNEWMDGWRGEGPKGDRRASLPYQSRKMSRRTETTLIIPSLAAATILLLPLARSIHVKSAYHHHHHHHHHHH